MVKTKDKTGVVILGLTGIGLLGWLLLREKAPIVPPDVIPSGEINWEGAGEGYSGVSALVEGTSVTALVTVTNQSTSGGIPVPYTFKVMIQLTGSGGYTAYASTGALSLAAGETKTYSISFSLPLDIYGSGFASAFLYTTDGLTMLGLALLPIVISEATQFGGYYGTLGPEYAFSTIANTNKNLTNGMAVTKGDSFTLRIPWKNTNVNLMTGHISATLLYIPWGQLDYLSASSGQDQTAGQNVSKVVGFNPFLMSNAGTYLLTVSLEYGGSLVARHKFNLVVS